MSESRRLRSGIRIDSAHALPSVLLLCCASSCRLRARRSTSTKGLQVEVVATGWFDAGIVNGQNKLVPSVTFKLKNVSDQKLVTLQVNALFRRVSETEEWGSGFLTVVGSEGLAAGATTATHHHQIRARLHRQRSVAAGDAAEHAVRRREGRTVRQVHGGRSGAARPAIRSSVS